MISWFYLIYLLFNVCTFNLNIFATIEINHPCWHIFFSGYSMFVNVSLADCLSVTLSPLLHLSLSLSLFIIHFWLVAAVLFLIFLYNFSPWLSTWTRRISMVLTTSARMFTCQRGLRSHQPSTQTCKSYLFIYLLSINLSKYSSTNFTCPIQLVNLNIYLTKVLE